MGLRRKLLDQIQPRLFLAFGVRLGVRRSVYVLHTRPTFWRLASRALRNLITSRSFSKLIEHTLDLEQCLAGRIGQEGIAHVLACVGGERGAHRRRCSV